MSPQIKLYTDENVSSVIVAGLRLRGIDVSAAGEVDMLGESDQLQLEYAANAGRVIFTQDDDFLRLHSQGVSHSGIVYAHQRTPIGEVVRGLLLICQVLQPEEMKNHVEFI